MTTRRDGGALSGKLAVMGSLRADDWETPPEVFDPLNREFGFTLDVAASPHNAKCERFLTHEDDGVIADWGTNVCWCNPPYGAAIARWIRKAWLAAKHGATVVLLIPARTDTAWWHDYAARGECRFLRGRIRFLRGGVPIGDAKRGSAQSPFPSAIVVFRPEHHTEAHRVA